MAAYFTLSPRSPRRHGSNSYLRRYPIGYQQHPSHNRHSPLCFRRRIIRLRTNSRSANMPRAAHTHACRGGTRRGRPTVATKIATTLPSCRYSAYWGCGPNRGSIHFSLVLAFLLLLIFMRYVACFSCFGGKL